MISIAQVLIGLLKNWEVIAALVQFLEKYNSDKLRKKSIDPITRGLQYAKETGDTSQLEEALRNHCATGSCRIP